MEPVIWGNAIKPCTTNNPVILEDLVILENPVM